MSPRIDTREKPAFLEGFISTHEAMEMLKLKKSAFYALMHSDQIPTGPKFAGARYVKRADVEKYANGAKEKIAELRASPRMIPTKKALRDAVRKAMDTAYAFSTDLSTADIVQEASAEVERWAADFKGVEIPA
jgi:hypothetical protein